MNLTPSRLFALFTKTLLVLALVAAPLVLFAGGAAVQIEPFLSGFRDMNGLPLAGGRVDVLVAGTGATATIWLDRGKGLHAPNPVWLDSAGRAVGGTGGTATPYGDGVYQLNVYTATGSLVYRIGVTPGGLEYSSRVQPGYVYLDRGTISSFSSYLSYMRNMSAASATLNGFALFNGTIANATASTLNVSSGLATFTRVDSPLSYINDLKTDRATVTVSLGVSDVYPYSGAQVRINGFLVVPPAYALEATDLQITRLVATGAVQFASTTSMIDATVVNLGVASATVANLTLTATPTSVMQAANRGYVDSRIASATSNILFGNTGNWPTGWTYVATGVPTLIASFSLTNTLADSLYLARSVTLQVSNEVAAGGYNTSLGVVLLVTQDGGSIAQAEVEMDSLTGKVSLPVTLSFFTTVIRGATSYFNVWVITGACHARVANDLPLNIYK